MIFLVAYDRRSQTLLHDIEEFADAMVGPARERRLEVQMSLPPEEGRYEVVLLEADSLLTVKETHARYFAANVSELVDEARSDLASSEGRFNERVKLAGGRAADST